MLLKIAWRNIWRNKLRSFVVIGSFIVGIWALIFMISFFYGMTDSLINNTIQNQTSHLQIHHPNFAKEQKSSLVIQDAQSIVSKLTEQEQIKAATSRVLVNGLISTAKGSRGVNIRGIHPNTEEATTKLSQQVIAGEFFTKKKNPILIGQSLADALKIKFDPEGRPKRLVLQFQDLNGDIVRGRFRVNGIYDTGNTKLDELNVFVRASDLQRLLGTASDEAHEIAVLLEDGTMTDTIKSELLTTFTQVDSVVIASTDTLSPTTYKAENVTLSVETYKDLNPLLKLTEQQMKLSSTIITIIFMMALVFGIINTMLMAILERIREIGMLMAIGMNKLKVFIMVVLETFMLCLIGAPIGVLAGHLMAKAFNKKGLDLSAFSDGLREFGMSEIVYPRIDTSFYLTIAIAVGITALIGSLYPALKAIRFRPVEALRKI